jgi:hypothetical protein
MILIGGPLLGDTTATAAPGAPATAPKITALYKGLYNSETVPADATNAVSPTEIMELINGYYEIIRPSGRKISTGAMSQLVGTSGTFLSDPSIMWDPSTDRFYFSIFENNVPPGSTTPYEGIAWGFSTTANPHSASDFCKYFDAFNYGTTSFPDRETLGDTSDFLLIGSDRYGTTGGEPALGSDIAWISKPPSGSSCPAQSSFQTGVQSVSTWDGASAFQYSPVPARQVDSSPTGWVLAVPYTFPDTSITLFSVTKDPTTGAADISGPINVPVPTYTIPPSAPQAGETTSGLPAPSLETRVYFSEAYMAFDPRVGHDVLWTADTTAGGAGSEVRWYEINPAADDLDQSGVISAPNLDVYNGSIAPDRLVDGSIAKFGSDAVINVNTSSSTAYTAIQTASLLNGAPSTPLMMVQQSTGPNIDFSCYEPGEDYCRWGDFSGASPDPGAATGGKVGRVWLSNQWNLPATDDESPVWRTGVYQVKP